MSEQQRCTSTLNLSGIPAESTIGRMLRMPLKLLPPDTQVRVLQGPLRGMRWIVGSGNHGCWLGCYEAAKQQRFAQSISAGQCVLDIGAHVGFYSLLSAVLVGETGKVFAIEPLPRNLTYLNKHIDLNGLSNVTVIAATVANTTGQARFSVNERSTQGRLTPGGELEVPVVSLDALVERRVVEDPDVVKIDVEGAELDVLRGAVRLLRDARPMIFLATHTFELHRACSDLLLALDYRLEDLRSARADADELGELIAFPH